MRCDDVAVNLPDYILGKIEPNLRNSIEVHLDGCARCKAELEGIRDPIRILGEVGYEEYPDSFWQELHASIMERVSKPAPSGWKVPAFAGAVAVVLLAVAVGIFQFSQHTARMPVRTLAALTTSLPPEQAVTLPSLNINYVDVVSSQANELDEMGAVDDSVQQAVVTALWNSISDSTITVDGVDYLGNSFSN